MDDLQKKQNEGGATDGKWAGGLLAIVNLVEIAAPDPGEIMGAPSDNKRNSARGLCVCSPTIHLPHQ